MRSFKFFMAGVVVALVTGVLTAEVGIHLIERKAFQ